MTHSNSDPYSLFTANDSPLALAHTLFSVQNDTATQEPLVECRCASGTGQERSEILITKKHPSRTSVVFTLDPAARHGSTRTTLLTIPLHASESLHLTFTLDVKSGVDRNGAFLLGCASSPQHLDRILSVDRRSDPNLVNCVNVQAISQDAFRSEHPSWTYTVPKSLISSGWARASKPLDTIYCALMRYDPSKDAFQTLVAFSFFIELLPAPSTPEIIAIFSDSNPRLTSGWPQPPLTPSASSQGELSPPPAPYNGLLSPVLPHRPSPIVRSNTSPTISAANSALPTALGEELTAFPFGDVAGGLAKLDQELEDGPLFRATLADLEKRTTALRKSTKALLKAAETKLSVLQQLDESEQRMDEALQDLGASNPPSVKALLEVYLTAARQTGRKALREEIQRLSHDIVEPLKHLHGVLKSFDAKKKAFDTESKNYYEGLSKASSFVEIFTHC